MKDIEPLQQQQEPWFEIRNAIDDSGLPKASVRLLLRVWRRGVCYEGVKKIARGCRLNHWYVRLLIRQLIARKILVRRCYPGKENELELTPTDTWILGTAEERAREARQSQTVGARTAAVKDEFWQRLRVMLNKYQAEEFGKKMAEDPDKFERVMADVVSRIRAAEAGLEPKLDNVEGYWLSLWKLFK